MSLMTVHLISLRSDILLHFTLFYLCTVPIFVLIRLIVLLILGFVTQKKLLILCIYYK